MEAFCQQRFCCIFPAAIKCAAVRQAYKQAACDKPPLPWRRNQSVEPVRWQSANGGGQKFQQVQRFFVLRLEYKLPEDVRFKAHDLANAGGKGLPLCKEIFTGEDDGAAVGGSR